MPEKKNPNTRREDGTMLKERVSIPRRYKVIVHNDDYTPMEFVVFILESVFRKSPAEATRVMLHVHKTGIGVAGTYSLEVAESKAAQCLDLARENSYPLLVTTEPE